MPVWMIRNATKGQIVAHHVKDASSFFSRFLGLMFQPPIPKGHGLLLRPCNAIHTWAMRFPIDVVYLDEAGRVLRVDRNLQPWRFAQPCRGAVAVLELPAGEASNVETNDAIELIPYESPRCARTT